MKYTGEKVATNQERLNELFDADPRTDSAIAESLHVSRQTISAWRNGTRSPKKSMLVLIAERFHVDLAWLMGYEVYSGIQRVETEEGQPDQPATEEARILAKGIDRLDPEERARALAVVKAMFAQHPDLFNE